MGRLYLLEGRVELGRRRALVTGTLVEAWPDLGRSDLFWVGEASKAALDGVGPPMRALLAIPSEAVPVYYGPRLADLQSLPTEESLRGRILSAGGIAAARMTYDASGARHAGEPSGPEDPVFFLRRPGSRQAHVWRLFRARAEAVAWARGDTPEDPEAERWAAALPAADFADLVARLGLPD